jgi:methyl-accepting chemotaxis protein
MSNTTTSFLSNLKVRNKLLLGFASLVCMILLMAYTGWTATEVLKSRGDRSEDVSNLSSIARDMRIERLVFFVKADDAQAAKWLAALEKTESQVKAIAPRFKSPANVELIKEAASVMERYRGFYLQATAATLEREKLREGFASSADATNELLLKFADVVNSDEGSLDARQKLASLFIAVQKMRTSFRAYAVLPSKNTEATIRQSLEVVINQLGSFRTTSIPEREVQALANAFADYNNKLASLVAVQTRVDDAQEGITSNITAILKITDRMTEIQQGLRASDAADAQQKIVIWLILSVILGLLAAWVITRSIVQPLQETVVIVEKIARGDFTYRSAVARRDELGVLQSSMLRMTSALRDLIGEMKDGVVQVASAAEELSAVTEQTSAGVNAQKQETEQIATAMQQMTATTHDVAKNAAQAVSTAQNASRLATEGGLVVEKTCSQIESLAGEMDATKKAMTALRANTQNIGGVLDVIKQVADQTNLLALNAAIEAARAGEAGRGFAVVADEVRGLAVRTRTSTDEIALLINELHTSTENMTLVLEQNLLLTDSSVALSRQASEMLLGVTTSVREIESMNEQIAVATEEQSSVGEEIGRGVINFRTRPQPLLKKRPTQAPSWRGLVRVCRR